MHSSDQPGCLVIKLRLSLQYMSQARYIQPPAQRFSARRPLLGKAWRWGGALLLVILLADLAYLAVIWPDWNDYSRGGIPKSRFIENYENNRATQSGLPPLRWRPVPYAQISKAMIRSVLVAEDSRFFEHGGIDPEALQEAMEYNWEHKKLTYGGSTITQQTAKNLFLSGARNPLRKLNELILTFGMEENLQKRRILELYLNIAEFGVGIFGVEAAAQYYFGVSAAELTYNQAVELAATLPAPKVSNPETRTRFFMRKRAAILRHL